MENSIEQIYKNFRSGQPISDNELSALIKNHKQMVDNLEKLNDRRFDLFRNQLNSDLYSLEGYVISRKQK